MAVEIHYVNVGLFHVDPNSDTVLLKNSTTTLNSSIARSSQEHRVIPNLTGSGSTPSSADYPKVADYLAAEAALGFALAYMDQYTIVTQMIT